VNQSPKNQPTNLCLLEGQINAVKFSYRPILKGSR
jgi:hypothetical protein